MKNFYKLTKMNEFCHPFKNGLNFEDSLEIQIDYYLWRLAKATNQGWNQEDSITINVYKWQVQKNEAF